MIKVLQVVTILDRGGEETMIMNYYRNIDSSIIQFDFLVHRDEKGVYEDEIINRGGNIYRAFPIRPWNYAKYRKWLKRFFEEHKNEYMAVHAHILENCGFVLEAAKEAGVPVRIAHSHLAQVNCCDKPNTDSTCNRAKYLFDDMPFSVMPNAVDTSIFAYRQDVRTEMRTELGLNGKLVIGNIARFHPVKNQTFLVDIFKEYLNINANAVLVLAGVGEEQENVRLKVHALQLDKKVKFLNLRDDINRVLQAIDIIVFPSKLEGLPLSLVEAQAAGVPCLLSDRVARETAITDLVDFIPLEASPAKWSEKISEILDGFVREDSSEKIKAAGYDIKTNVEDLKAIYLYKK